MKISVDQRVVLESIRDGKIDLTQAQQYTGFDEDTLREMYSVLERKGLIAAVRKIDPKTRKEISGIALTDKAQDCFEYEEE